MFNKNTKENINAILKQYGAKISTKDKCLQSKDIGYVGLQFKNDKRQVYNFDIVSVKDGKSFANTKSDIYRKIPREILTEVLCSYYENNKSIFIG